MIYQLLLGALLAAGVSAKPFNPDDIGVEEIRGTATYNPCNPPVILVPGLGGSIIDYKIDETFVPKNDICKATYTPVGEWSTGEHRLWPSLAVVGPPAQYACWESEFQLQWDAARKNFIEYPGLQSRARDWGGVTGIDNLFKVTDDWGPAISSIFDNMIKEMVNNRGYQVYKNLRGAPYDFRKTPQVDYMKQFYADLKALVEETYNIHKTECPSKPHVVHLVGHSMGTSMIQMFLANIDQTWKNTYIKTASSVGGPFLGGSKSLRSALSGDSQGMPGGNQKYLPVEALMGGVLWMVPAVGAPENNRVLVELDLDDGTHGMYRGTLQDMSSLLSYNEARLGIPGIVDFFHTYVVPSVPVLQAAPNVEWYCVYGTGQVTEDYYVYDGTMDSDPDTYREQYHNQIYPPADELLLPYSRLDFIRKTYRDDPSQGDGTVGLPSLNACSKWIGKNGGKPMTVKVFPGKGHVSALTSTEFISWYLSTVLQI